MTDVCSISGLQKGYGAVPSVHYRVFDALQRHSVLAGVAVVSH